MKMQSVIFTPAGVRFGLCQDGTVATVRLSNDGWEILEVISPADALHSPTLAKLEANRDYMRALKGN